MKIRCTLKNTLKVPSIWNEQLHGLEGEVVHVEKSAWGGYIIQVKLDKPPSWCGNPVHVYACEKYRDVIVEFSEEELKDIRLIIKGLMNIDREIIPILE